jgi:hypothetical protein
MTSTDATPLGEAPDVPSTCRVDLYRRLPTDTRYDPGLRSWIQIVIESPDPWVPNIRMTIENDKLRVEDHSHKGMAEKILSLMRPALQQMCGVLVEDATGEPIDL